MNSLNDDCKIRRMTSQGSYKIVKLLMNEEPTGNKSAMYDACQSDPWFISDIHISNNMRRTEEIWIDINRKVKPNDCLIILGDLTDKHTGSLRLTEKFMSQIVTTKRFLILGNNDFYTIGDYVDMGFVYIDDSFRFKHNGQNYVLTHCPVPVGNSGAINIHGHIHGSGIYWNMSPEGHYDVFVGTDAVPRVVRFSELIGGDK